MRLCKKCGALLQDDEVKCPVCGARNKKGAPTDNQKVTFAESEKGATVKKEKEVHENFHISDSPSASESNNPEVITVNSSNAGKFVVLFIIALFMIGGMTGVILAIANSFSPSTPTYSGFGFDDDYVAARDGWYSEGTYSVGIDIEPGEYVFERPNEDYFATLHVYPTSSYGGNFQKIDGRYYFTLNDGDEIDVKNAVFALSSKVSPVASTSDKYITALYKVGFDIEPGEYLITTSSTSLTNLSVVNSSDRMNYTLRFDDFYNRAYVKVKNGEYLQVENSKVESISKVTSLAYDNTRMPAGMYKVGFDMNPGDYTFDATSGASIKIYSECSYDSKDVVTLNNFNKKQSKTYNLVSGQYVKITGGTLHA